MRHSTSKRLRCFTLAAVVALLVGAAAVAAHAAPVTGFGCYANYEEVGGLSAWPAHCRLMKACGMNTFALFYRDEVAVQEQLDAAVEARMLEPSIPVMLVSNAGPAVGKRLLGEARWAAICAADTNPPSGFAPGEAAIPAAVVKAARARARHADQWPELLAYNYDEPGHGEASWAGQASVAAVTKAFNATGLRCGTAVCHPHITNLVDCLDVLCVNLIIGADLWRVRCELLGQGKPWWVYEIMTFGMTETAVRYNVGVQTWLLEAENRLTWSWTRLLGPQKDMARPVLSPVLRGYAAGVRDYHRLRLQEQSMARARMGFDWEGFPVEQFTRGPDKWRTWEPPAEWLRITGVQ